MINLLQVQSTKVNDVVLQYGILGVVALVLAYFAWHQYKRLIEKNDILEKKVDKLQDDMMQLIIEERDRMSKLIEENSKALDKLHNVILTYLIKVDHKDSDLN